MLQFKGKIFCNLALITLVNLRRTSRKRPNFLSYPSNCDRNAADILQIISKKVKKTQHNGHKNSPYRLSYAIKSIHFTSYSTSNPQSFPLFIAGTPSVNQVADRSPFSNQSKNCCSLICISLRFLLSIRLWASPL